MTDHFNGPDPVKQPVVIPIADPPVPSTTTVEEDRHSASQRKVNLVWEFTQSAIAILVTIATILGTLQVGGVMGNESLTNGFFLIIGFYFGRTNHQKVGGVTLGR